MDAAVFGCLVDLDSYEMQGEKRPEWGKELQIGVSLVVRCGLRDEKTYQKSRIERQIKRRNVCMIPIYDSDKAWRGSAIAECGISEKEVLTIEICVPESERRTDIWLVIVRGEIFRQDVPYFV